MRRLVTVWMVVLLCVLPGMALQARSEDLWKQVMDAPPFLVLDGVAAELNKALDQVLKKCLEKEPDKRYRSIKALRAVLDAIQPGEIGSGALNDLVQSN